MRFRKENEFKNRFRKGIFLRFSGNFHGKWKMPFPEMIPSSSPNPNLNPNPKVTYNPKFYGV